jgi:urease accessory protein
MKNRYIPNPVLAAGALLSCAAAPALAHPGHALHLHATGEMFLAGVLHPLTGLDHLLAMLAVGLWAALTHKEPRQALWTPASFLILLLVGALLGIGGVRLPAVEPIIMASLLVLGLLVAGRASLPRWGASALVGFFAIFHGLAHGAELPQDQGAAMFITGFMLSTLCLHLAGLGLGYALKRRGTVLTGLTGAGIAGYGLALLAASF